VERLFRPVDPTLEEGISTVNTSRHPEVARSVVNILRNVNELTPAAILRYHIWVVTW